MKKPMQDMMKRPRYDNLYTPVEAIWPLIKYLPCYKNGLAPWKYWECTDYGESNITKILKEKGFDVIGTDIVNGFDFLLDQPDFEFDFIVTNPPYSLKNKFIKKCYDYGKPFALLLPITTLETVNRGKMFEQYGISLVVLDNRIDFTGKKTPWHNVSWFIGNYFEQNYLFFEHVE